MTALVEVYVLLSSDSSSTPPRLDMEYQKRDPSGSCFVVLIQEAEASGGTKGSGMLYARVEEFIRTGPSADDRHFLDKEGRSLAIIHDELRLAELSELLRQDRLISCQIAISDRMYQPEQFKTAYAQALKTLRYFFLKSAAGILHYGQLKDKSGDFVIPTEDIIKVGNMIGTGREQEMQRLLSQVLDYHTILDNDISYLERISTAINELIFDKVFNDYGKEAVDIIKVYRRIGYLYNSRNFQDYYHGVENLLNQMNDFIMGIKSAHLNRKEMEKALHFIEQNFSRSDFNLALVSNHVSFNYSYFSSAFKDYMGMSFSQYLKKVRLVRAKELLESSTYKVYEVSAKVGFENPKHFNKVFREAEGISPLEFRLTAGLKNHSILPENMKEDKQE